MDGLDKTPEVSGSQGTLRIMGKPGDTKQIWNRDNVAEVEAARKTFDELVKKGYFAYKVRPGGDKGEQIKAFDASAEAVILVPPMKGGV